MNIGTSFEISEIINMKCTLTILKNHNIDVHINPTKLFCNEISTTTFLLRELIPNQTSFGSQLI